MRAVRHTELAKFWRLAEPVYISDPLRHTIALTVLRKRMAAPDPGAEPPLLVTFDHDGVTVGAAFATPPWPVGVSGVPDEAMPELVRLLHDIDYQVTGVSAPLDRADAFADAWLATAEGAKHLVFELRLYRLAGLVVPGGPGFARRATKTDLPLLADWRAVFAREVGHVDRPEDHADVVSRSMIAGNAHLLWELDWELDGEPVAYAAVSKPTTGMSRIGPVYTPPRHRSHGYGSAVTAAAAQWALDAGAEHVILFTDLANPTTNSVYQKIGFTPHHDAVEYRFA